MVKSVLIFLNANHDNMVGFPKSLMSNISLINYVSLQILNNLAETIVLLCVHVNSVELVVSEL